MVLTKIKTFLGVEELKNYKVLLKQLFSECLATFLYISLVLLAGSGVSSDASVVIVALANGFIIATMVQIFGPVSGCHMNPAVTAGLMICGHIKPLRALFYVAVQIAGGVVGSLVAFRISADSLRGNLGATLPHEDSREGQILTLEFLLTFLLVSIILSVIDNNRGAKGLGSVSLAIGVCVAGCLCSCLPYTGSLNPVRTLGPALVMKMWKFHWVYWLGPMLGGVLAGILYKFVLRGDEYNN